jgi:hypothetical protein
MEYIEGKITPSGKKGGYIILSSDNRTKAKKIFGDFIGKEKKKLDIATNEGVWGTITFGKEGKSNHQILIYSDYFRTLEVGDVIYLQVKDENTVLITDTEPSSDISEMVPKT